MKLQKIEGSAFNLLARLKNFFERVYESHDWAERPDLRQYGYYLGLGKLPCDGLVLSLRPLPLLGRASL